MALTFKPLSDNVLIDYEDKDEEKTKGGIIMTSRERPQQGIAVAVGPGRKTKTGERLSMTVKVGDAVLYGQYSGTELKIENGEYLIMKESDIYGIY